MSTTTSTARKVQFSKSLVLSGIVGSLILGCSGSDTGSPPPGTGGDTSAGGNSSASGSTAMGGAGGSLMTGGTTASGGVNATGGTNSTGGAIATGGSNATGGTTSAGGTVATGGSKATGGTTSTAGTAATGGSKATGGTTSAGGTAATGGSKATGGVPATGGAPATGGTTSAGGTTSSSCGIPTYDAANPPTTLTLTGNLGTHDPSMILAGGVYYQYATGNGIGYKTSNNLTAWTGQPDVFNAIPAWVAGSVSGVTNIWACLLYTS